MNIFAAFVAATGLASGASAVNVLMLSTTDPAWDAAAKAALVAGGHTVTLGPAWPDFTDAVDLSGFDVVYFQGALGGAPPDMPGSGQQALLDFVDAGGGLVTSEWVNYFSAGGRFQDLRDLFPTLFITWLGGGNPTFTEVTHDATLSDGLDKSFEFPVDGFGGSESYLLPGCGATEYYHSSQTNDAGVTGWNYGIGRVLAFSILNGPNELGDPDGARLLSNAMKWASLAGGPPLGVYADCDHSKVLDLFDFLCFTNAFNADQDYADCNGSGGLDLFDFLCFVNAFNAGC